MNIILIMMIINLIRAYHYHDYYVYYNHHLAMGTRGGAECTRRRRTNPAYAIYMHNGTRNNNNDIGI